MKTLYIVRHAKAVRRDLPISDIERTLSDRGQRDAHVMAEYTHIHGPIPELLLSSPAVRAFATARAFAQIYQYPVARIRTYPCLYHDTDTNALLQLVQHLDDAMQTAMVCTHHPLCTNSAHDLAPTFCQTMPTSAVVCLQLHVSSWAEVAPGRGVAAWFHHPHHTPTHQPLAPAIDALRAPPALIFQPASSFDATHFANDLQDIYTVRSEPSTHRHVTYFETFDWRLYNQALTLQWEAPHLRLHALSDDRQHDRESLPAPPTHAAGLPLGDLRRRLEKVVDSRALLPLFDCASEFNPWRLLNADDKTVARLVVERHTCANAQGATPPLYRLCLKPLKGYAQEAEQVQQWLLAHGFLPTHMPLYASALAALDITPNDYSAKPLFQLTPEMRADAALRSILRFLFRIMRQNEAGIINDIDTEFLHDFRVASRRARSAVGQIKRVFDAPTTQQLKQDLASLGTMTNRLRDLDVYLLRQADYRAKLPVEHREALGALFDLLHHDRKQALQSLKRKLRGKTYAALMSRWETFLEAEPCTQALETAPNAARPIRKVAQKRLSKLSARVIKSGHLMLSGEHDERLHELRIDCKKLRYLLEFTSSLFPPAAVAPVLRHLRKLQDVLGDFHDGCVQQETLKAYAEYFEADTAEAEATHQAILHLIDILEQDKQVHKAAFSERFTTFAATIEGKHQPWKHKA
jgi:CHAD domain-containing protein/phosphohistidine phosphatase SixA